MNTCIGSRTIHRHIEKKFHVSSSNYNSLHIRFFKALARSLGKNTSPNKISLAQNKTVVSDCEWILVLFFHVMLLYKWIINTESCFLMFNLSHNASTIKKKLPTYRSHCHLILHRFKSSNHINIQWITMISIETTENNDDCGRQFRIVIFATIEVRVQLFPITRINQDFCLR
mgnify:CR=1 FL=1